MKTTKPKSGSRRAPRPVRVPPPLTRGDEKFEGSSVLSEFEGEFGILLWQSLRNVLLWAATDPARRKGLFSAGAEERRRVKLLSADMDDALRGPLAVIARLLADPAGADRRRVAAACQRIGEWAEKNDKTATSLAYIQAAALTAASDARLSYSVGRIARERAEYPRAETWFRRAILLGRQSGDWESYALAFGGLGNLYLQRGNLPAAHKSFLRAYRAAKRKGLRNVQGMALHDLFVVAVKRQQVRDAEELAASALRAYGPNHALLPVLAHDVAVFWMDQGIFAPALTVLTALQTHFPRAGMHARVLAHIAKAAAGIDDRKRFEEAWSAAASLAGGAGPVEKVAWVYLALAEAAAMMQEWDRTIDAAKRAILLADAREETQVKDQAEAWLVQANEEQSARTAVKSDMDPWVQDHADSLAVNFARSLESKVAAR
ncbi:MAG TPA: tetratricopeptide repeat protein [Longimicrobiaceae bacterium]|nr:tetratricopeptide repeat protein [Longimicrobiaceae bacterium]